MSSVAGAVTGAAISSLSHKSSSGGSKGKVKRDIPKPTVEETQLLNNLIDLVNNKDNYQTYSPLKELLANPYSTSTESAPLFDLLLKGWGRGTGMSGQRRMVGHYGGSHINGAYGVYGIPFGGGLPPIYGDNNSFYNDITSGW